MGYATVDQVRAELEPYPEIPLPGDDALERLIATGQRAVDARIGPYPILPTGTKLDPAELTDPQAEALVRAVAVAVAHQLLTESESLFGVDDVLPAQVTLLRGSGLDARLDAELAGHGLIARTLCAAPTIEDPPDAVA
jgi:hypothetical protein